MAGYSDTPLLRKLGIRPGMTAYLDLAAEEPVPIDVDALCLRDVTTRRLPRSFDAALVFTSRHRRLDVRLPLLLARMATDGMVWVCWPKKAARVPTDLDDNLVRESGLRAGVVDVKVAAIDEVWSGLKFVRRLSDR